MEVGIVKRLWFEKSFVASLSGWPGLGCFIIIRLSADISSREDESVSRWSWSLPWKGNELLESMFERVAASCCLRQQQF